MNREERKYFYEKLRELFAEWVNDADTDIKSHIYDMITSFEERYMTNVTGQQPFPQDLFRVFLDEHALVHKLQQRGAFKVVEELPTEDIDIYSIYLLRKGGITEEWIYFEGKWEFIGSPGIDLTDFQEKVDENLKTDNKTVVGAINEVNSKIVVVDEQLSTTSKNPVQNDTVTREIRATAQRIVEIERELSTAIDNSDKGNKESIGELESNVNDVVINMNANKNEVIAITGSLRSDINNVQSKNEKLQADLVAAQENLQALQGTVNGMYANAQLDTKLDGKMDDGDAYLKAETYTQAEVDGLVATAKAEAIAAFTAISDPEILGLFGKTEA